MPRQLSSKERDGTGSVHVDIRAAVACISDRYYVHRGGADVSTTIAIAGRGGASIGTSISREPRSVHGYVVGGQNDNSEEYMTCDHGGADRQEHDQRVRMRSSQWSKVYSGHHSQGDEDPERKSPTSSCTGEWNNPRGPPDQVGMGQL